MNSEFDMSRDALVAATGFDNFVFEIGYSPVTSDL